MPALQQRKADIAARYGTREQFLTTFNPDSAEKLVHDTDACYFGGAPTIAELNATYGSRTGAMWLVPQLYRLSEYCGVRDKLEGNALKECASILASEYPYLKVSEFMLFFHRFKAGKYGRFYGAVDPLVIAMALQDFIGERSYAYAHREMQQQPKGEAISWEEYCMRTYGEVRPLSTLFGK